jgi:hypothetical protein
VKLLHDMTKARKVSTERVVNSHYQLLVSNCYAWKHVVEVRDQIPLCDTVTRNKEYSD